MNDVILAYEQKQVDLHAWIWLRYEGEVEVEPPDRKKGIGEETLLRSDSHTRPDGITETLEVYGQKRRGERIQETRKIRSTSNGYRVQYICTTPGRVIFNKTIQDALVS